MAMLLSIAIPPIARADPPPTWTGAWLEVNPSHGRVADGFTMGYWYVTEGCPFALVSWSWDGQDLGTSQLDPTTCNATRRLDVPPTRELGPHTVGAVGCEVDPTDGSVFCNDKSAAQVTYYIDPTPTLRARPDQGPRHGRAQGDLRHGRHECGYNNARFTWDGAAIDPPVVMSGGSCVAVLDLASAPQPNAPGKHVVTAMACDGVECDRTTIATATYVVQPKPTPRPTPRPTPTPTPTPKPTPRRARPPARARARVRFQARPRSPPRRSSARRAHPTRRQRRPWSRSSLPTTAPTAPPPAAPRGNPFVPAIVASVQGPEAGPFDPAVVATNLFLTLLLVFLFGLTAEIFNSTMDANRDEIHGWWARLAGGPLRILRPLRAPAAVVDGLSSWDASAGSAASSASFSCLPCSAWSTAS